MPEHAGGLTRMRQIQLTWLTAGMLALVIGVGPTQAQKKDDKAPAADPKQMLINGIVAATNDAMKAAPGTTVFTADPVAQTVVPDPATTVAMTLTVDYLKASDNKIYAPFTVTLQPDVIGKGANLAA